MFIEQYDSLCGHSGYNLDKGGGQASYFKKPVCQYDFYFKFVKKYDSAMDADRETGIYFGDISKCCNKKRKAQVDIIGVLMEIQLIQRTIKKSKIDQL